MSTRPLLPTPVPLYLYGVFAVTQLLFLWGSVALLIGTTSLIPRVIAAVMGASNIVMLVLLGTIHHLDHAPRP